MKKSKSFKTLKLSKNVISTFSNVKGGNRTQLPKTFEPNCETDPRICFFPDTFNNTTCLGN